MNLILRRIVLCLFTTVYIIRASCQGFNTDPDITTYESKKLTSIHSANDYIEANAWDTLNSNLFLSLDSSYVKSHDTLQDKWHDNLLIAWEKVISKKYKVNYSEGLEFLKLKKLQDYYIDFGYEDYTYNAKDSN